LVGVLDAKNVCTALLLGEKIVIEGGPKTPNMEIASR
jgi:hypothetical protein